MQIIDTREVRMRWSPLAALVLCTLGSLTDRATLQAQDMAGTRVRLRPVAARPLIGRLERIGSDSVVLRDADGVRHAFARTAVARLDVSQGRKTRLLQGAVIGLGSGAAVGLAVGLLADAQADRAYEARCTGSAFGCHGRWSDGIEVPIATAIGAGVGVLAGTLVGSIAVEQWQRLPIADALSWRAQPGALVLSTRF